MRCQLAGKRSHALEGGAGYRMLCHEPVQPFLPKQPACNVVLEAADNGRERMREWKELGNGGE